MEKFIHAQEIQGVKNKIKISEPIVLADNEKAHRSGHVGHALTEFAPGKIMAFSANTSFDRFCGHSVYGWMDYRISEDYGKTWGKPKVFPYSWEKFLEGINFVFVEKAITCSDGTIAAFCSMNDAENSKYCVCEPHAVPEVVISSDGGKTWGKPIKIGDYRGRIFQALYKNGVAYVLIFCNDAEVSFTGSKPEHVYRLFKSEDNCRSFYDAGVIPFADTTGRGYGTMVFNEKNELIAYAYNLNDQYNMDYIVSKDHGKTWGETGKSYCAKMIRNPQVAVLDGQYILHGRSGGDEKGLESFVLYTSSDGTNWDDGVLLDPVKRRNACFYSDNLVVTKPDGKQVMFVQYSENIYVFDIKTDWRAQVNSMLLEIESVK